MTTNSALKKDFLLLWVITVSIVFTLIVYLSLCYFQADNWRLATDPPIVLRSIFYGLAIIIFPLTNLLRHVMLRLNQTMLGSQPAKSRYFKSVFISLCLAELIGLLGFISYLMGDDCQTLFIFCSLSALALFLYRPKIEEYLSIIEAIAKLASEAVTDKPTPTTNTS